MPFVSMRSKCRQLPKQMLLSSLSHGGNARPSRGRNKFLRDRLNCSHCAAITGWSAIASLSALTQGADISRGTGVAIRPHRLALISFQSKPYQSAN
jgi:hypothetical protein